MMTTINIIFGRTIKQYVNHYNFVCTACSRAINAYISPPTSISCKSYSPKYGLRVVAGFVSLNGMYRLLRETEFHPETLARLRKSTGQ